MSTTARRPVRRLALLAAAALAMVGLTAAPASAEAPSVTISPTAATPGTITSFTVTVSASATSSAAQTISITVPVQFTNPSLDSWSASKTGWLSPIGPNVTAAGSTWTFTSPGNDKLNSNEQVAATFSAVTPTVSGTYTWTTSGTTNGSTAIAGFTSPTVTVGVVKQDQTITFDAIADQTFGSGALTLGATASSGLAVTYTSTGNCSVSGSQLSLGDVGNCSVTAHQAGDTTWNAAPDATQAFHIVKADQTISFPAITPPTFGDAPLDLTATATSGLAVTFSSSTPSVCTVSGTQLTIVAVGDCTVTADQAGNDNYDPAPSSPQTFSVLKATATLTLSDVNHTYDGNPHGATVTTDPVGLGTVTVTYDGSTTEPTDAGSYAVHAELDNANYSGFVNGTLVIDKKVVHGTATITTKPYDGTDVASIADCAVSGIEPADHVELDCSGATAAFDGVGAGSHDVTITGAELSGTTGLGNYEFGGFETVTGSIDQRVVTAHLQAGDKEYDGTAVASASATLSNVVAGEGTSVIDVRVVSASFANKNVETDKTVTATVELTGTGKDNYVLASDVVTDLASINALHITGTFTAQNKVYDGMTSATVTGRDLVGVLSPGGVLDDVQLDGGTAAFASSDAADGVVVSLTGAGLVGADADNYALDSVATTTANITRRSVAGSFTASDKVWDGNTDAAIATRTLAAASGDTGKIAGDDLSLTGGTATFDNANVGTGKTVTGSGFSLSGSDAGNYTLTPAQPWTTTASISPLYRGTGFYQPVDMPTVTNPIIWNTIKGGQTVPLKFEVFNAQSGVEQTALTIFGADATAQAKAFSAVSVSCSTGTSATEDAIEMTTTGGTSLRYDTTGGQFIQNWKTPATSGSCYKVSVKTVDGTMVGPAYFKIK